MFDFSIQLGMSSSQLTFTHIFQRGRYTTNQYSSLQATAPLNWAEGDAEAAHAAQANLSVGFGKGNRRTGKMGHFFIDDELM